MKILHVLAAVGDKAYYVAPKLSSRVIESVVKEIHVTENDEWYMIGHLVWCRNEFEKGLVDKGEKSELKIACFFNKTKAQRFLRSLNS